MKTLYGLSLITLMLAFTVFSMAVQVQPQLKTQAACGMQSIIDSSAGLNGTIAAARHNCLNSA